MGGSVSGFTRSTPDGESGFAASIAPFVEGREGLTEALEIGRLRR